MSDPFPTLEADLGVSLALLKVLAENHYPTVISTKGVVLGQSEYLNELTTGDFVVQVSFSTRSDRLAAEIDFGAPSPSARIEMIQQLAEAGVPTAARLQPLIPGREAEAAEFIEELASAGVRHVGVEHLKLPVEGWTGSARLGAALASDVKQQFRVAGAKRVGREWILPVEDRLPSVLALRESAHRRGLSFGAADSDLLPLSDGIYCCSGADQLLAGGSGFEHNYLGAVRRADANGEISISSLQDVWAPSASIAMMVNSNSRLASNDGTGAGVTDYVRANWNGRANGNSPGMFYGVIPTGERDTTGYSIYRVTAELGNLMRSAG